MTESVSLLLTDIERSTALWEADPLGMRHALARHDELLRRAVQANAGDVLKSVGDGIWGVFDEAREAVAAAVDAQCAIRTEDWADTDPLRIRIALHTAPAAEVEERAGDLFGPPLNRCARLMDLAHPGQVLATAAVHGAVADPPAEVTFRDLGTHRLRDLREAEHVYQVVHPELPVEFPAPRSLDAFPHNLPVQRTSFIGRDADVREIVGFLGSERLVCLTGAGGAGKSRLALAVAAELVGRFADGVWLVDLAGLRDPDLVPHVVASTFGVREEGGRHLTDVLADFARPSELLVVLDNCEHLVGACAHLADVLLAAAPDLRMLATSRERLDVPGEVVCPVPPLSSRTADGPGDAARLFLDRVRAVAPDLQLTDSDHETVTEISRRLDGIPLALELAAARLVVLSPRELLARLDDRLRLLTGGARTSLPHHQTLRATLDWSHDLLDEQERTVFRRLGVFADAVTLWAIEQVVPGGDLAVDDVLDVLGALVAKSLVTLERSGAETRYGMLETIREYARERLVEAGEAELARDRHADLVLRASVDARKLLPSRARETVDVSDADVRAALDWLEGTRPVEAVEVAASFANVWWINGHLTEGRRHLERALDAAGQDVPAGLQGRALTEMAMLAVSAGDLSTGDDYARRAMEGGGRYRSTVICLWARATVAWAHGDLGAATRFHEEGLALARELDFENGIRFHLDTFARVHRTAGDFDQAERLLLEELSLYGDDTDPTWVAGVLDGLARVAYLRGEAARARDLASEALQRYEAGGYTEGMGSALTIRALARAAGGEVDHAAEDLRRAIHLYRRMGHRGGLVGAIEAAAPLAAARERGDDAARLLGFASSLRAALGQGPGGEEPLLLGDLEDRLRSVLGTDVERLRKEGQALDLDAALDLAVGG